MKGRTSQQALTACHSLLMQRLHRCTTGDKVPGADFGQANLLIGALGCGVLTPWCKTTARCRIDRRGDLPLQHHTLHFVIKMNRRDRRQKSTSIGMGRILE